MLNDVVKWSRNVLNLTLGEIWKGFCLFKKKKIRHKSPVCAVCSPDCSRSVESVGMQCCPFLCVIAFRALQEQGFLTGVYSPESRLNAPWQHRGCVEFIFYPEIWPQRAASLTLGSINNATFLDCCGQLPLLSPSLCTPTAAASCRKERRRRSRTQSRPQESPSMHVKEPPHAFDGTRVGTATETPTRWAAVTQEKWFNSALKSFPFSGVEVNRIIMIVRKCFTSC